MPPRMPMADEPVVKVENASVPVVSFQPIVVAVPIFVADPGHVTPPVQVGPGRFNYDARFPSFPGRPLPGIIRRIGAFRH